MSAVMGGTVARADGLDARRLAILMGTGVVLWLIAMALIHFRGPMGAFEGAWLPIGYALTIPGTIPGIWAGRTLAGLPKSRTLTVVAVQSMTALFLDAVAFNAFRWVYSTDPEVVIGGAVWLLWAIGVAIGLGLVMGGEPAEAA